MNKVMLAVSIAATLWAAVARGDGTSCALEVRVTELEHDQGQVMVSVFDKSEGFPGGGPDAALATLVAAPADSEASVTFTELLCGTYAIAAHHDEDGNGEMKTVYGTIPLEGIGISRDAKGVMGPPKFADARIELTPESEPVVIIMRY